MEKQLHVVAVAFPAQGHVMPLMRFSHKLVDYGVKVTFVNSQLIIKRIESSMAEKSTHINNLLRLISVPDGYENGEKQIDPSKVDVMLEGMRPHIEELIKNLNEEEKITCVIAEISLGWVLEAAEKMGIKVAAFCPASISNSVSTLQIPKLMEEGIIDENGMPTKIATIQHSPNMLSNSTADLWWTKINDPTVQNTLFKLLKTNVQGLKIPSWILFNSIYDLEPDSCDMISGILPIGPLLLTNQLGRPTGNFWPEDSTCLSWLDEQPLNSVIYVAFGSLTIFNQQQFDELALGLELLDRPFLWVIRSNFVNGVIGTEPDRVIGRVPHHGKIVTWAPQDKVLAHPSVSCFLSHCGWNSTMEGLTFGVPFLCFPNSLDQFKNQQYICDLWKVGLRLDPDEDGIISRNEVKRKVKQLLCDEVIKAKALELKEMAIASISEGGSSWKNFKCFLEFLQN